jgi:hypothetical protein
MTQEYLPMKNYCRSVVRGYVIQASVVHINLWGYKYPPENPILVNILKFKEHSRFHLHTVKNIDPMTENLIWKTLYWMKILYMLPGTSVGHGRQKKIGV